MASDTQKGERIAKIIARAGLCSRREAERLVLEGRVVVDGKRLEHPAHNVLLKQNISIDGKQLVRKQHTRLWLYHKPRGLITSAHDPQGRPTVFAALPDALPRVISIGRLDMNTEGLLLLTNDGMLARHLELPQTGWLRRYRVRAFGTVGQESLDALQDGVAIDGVLYGSIQAHIERKQGANIWLSFALREGKNREIKKIIEHLGLTVNRLIRISYGPFQLQELAKGDVREVRNQILQDQLGKKVISRLGLVFDKRDNTKSPLITSRPKNLSKNKPRGKTRADRRRSI